MHILIVEDERRMAQRIRRVLSEERHSVDLAHDGRSGLDLGPVGVVELLGVVPGAAVGRPHLSGRRLH